MDEATKSRLDRCWAIRRGHGGVVTKITKEVDEILAQATLSEKHYIRLNRQLEAKSSLLADQDREILACCNPGEIESQIEESETVTAKIIGVKAKSNLWRKQTQVESSTRQQSPNMDQYLCLWRNHSFQSSLFPLLEVMSLDGSPFGIPTILPSTATHSCQR